MMVLRSSAARLPGSARDSRCRRPPFDLLDSSSEFISLESPSLSRRRIWTRSEAPSAAARAAGPRITRGEFSSGQIECFSEHCLRSMRKNMPPCSDSSFDKSMEILSENVSRRLFRRQLEKQKLDHKKEYKEASRTLKMRADTNTEEQDHEDNGDLEVRRSCRLQQSRYTTTNESVLFDKLVTNTAEAVLQKMDDIEKMCRRQEMENRGMFRDAKGNISMYSQRRKGVQRAAEETDDNQVSSEEEEEEEVEYTRKRYSLRKRKAVERYQAPLERPRQHEANFGSCSSRVTQRHSLRSAQSQGHKRTNRQRHRVISEISDSTSYTSSDDEEHFGKRRKLTNDRHLRRCLPLNSQKNELNRIDSNQSKHGASPSDVEPMQIDSSIRFDSVGGLSDHIAALKEIIVFPLVYPEVLERLKIQPPRGCLFYGPPGTGKTLIARALANECSQGDRKVSFFMRKGADCLSKWVGESEQQLRSLFDQAYQMQPSIIFFDEIDGLAPVRSSKQDQIYSSIVSTLLALMDGLDSRGEVVVIGATNRLDSIDPALRRPGRFDREFLFSLPNKEARKEIFQIHTRNWIPKPSGTFLEELAEKCVGYCGADIKSLCTEAALSALRRCYPQIYKSTKKLHIDVASIKIIEVDFDVALQKTVASSQKAVASPGQPLAPVLKPLLDNTLTRLLQALLRVFPHAELALKKHQQQGGLNCVLRNDAIDSGSESPAIFEDKTVHKRPGTQKEKILSFGRNAYCQPTACRPRFLLVGEPGYGQTSHLAPALIHALEKFPVYNLGLSSLLVGITSPEERCAQLMQEAQRRAPSIIYIPQIHLWWESVGASLKSTFSMLLQNIPAFAPVLLLATSDVPYVELPKEIEDLFINKEEVFKIRLPHREERRMFFEDLLVNQAARCPASENNAVISKSKCKRDKESSGIATKRRKFQFNKENKVPENQNELDSDTEDCCVMGENAMRSEREMDAHKQPGTGCYWEFEQLLDYVAERTKKFTIFQLEKLYALLSQCIYQQRDDDNKTKLLQEMKKEITGFNYLQ